MNINKMKFFTINNEYIKFLRTIEPKIQLNEKQQRNHQPKPYIGVIINIQEHQYYAPLSSYKPHKHDKIKNNSVYKIYGDTQKTEKLSVLHLNNMFPVIQTEITYMDFNNYDPNYKNLLEKEYSYIISNQEDIKIKANHLYQDVKNNKWISKISNDFQKLEREYKNFIR